MSNRISVEPVHGAPAAAKTPCPACGGTYSLAQYAEAIDHAIGKKFPLAILTCECGLVRNRSDLGKILPANIYKAVFFS